MRDEPARPLLHTEELSALSGLRIGDLKQRKAVRPSSMAETGNDPFRVHAMRLTMACEGIVMGLSDQPFKVMYRIAAGC